jgi:PBSX family phage terminase large subunit
MVFSQKQAQSFCEATKRLNIWVGAVRSGKTYSSIHKLIDILRNGPDGACMIIGVNRDSIQRNVLLDLYRILGFPAPSSKSTESKLYGKHIYFIGANDEGSVRRIQGSSLASAYVDEATCIPAPFWRMLLSRLSIKDAQLLATCNPEGPAHWLKKEYIDRANELDLIYWNFTLEDNPSLDKKYVESLKKEYSGMWYKRYILGEWAVAHGLVYDSFDHLNIFSDRLTPPNYYTIGLDYGTTNATAAVLLAITPTQWPQIRVEEEYYYDSAKKGRSQTDSELAEDIKEFIGYKSINAIYIDPAAASLKAELRRKNLPVIDAKNDVLQGIKVTSKFIAQKNIVIHRGCQVLLDHIQSYAWDPKAADRGEDKPLKVRDHILDALRYAILSSFPTGELCNPDEQLTVDQLRKQIYGDNDFLNIGMGSGGYC